MCLKMVCNTNNYLNTDHDDLAEDLGDSLFSDKPIQNRIADLIFNKKGTSNIVKMIS